ncbi:MAG: hypothetical protein FJY97_07505 [candidate division Zixibacteria bacterium]|nr:hypothetical protein [candidate division Zixibacteria bacterium]
MAVCIAIYGAPFVFPLLRPFYAPFHDSLLLPAVGYLWYYPFPFSAFILPPAVALLCAGWGTWLIDISPLTGLRTQLTRLFFSLQPDARWYLAVKKIHLAVISYNGRLPTHGDGFRLFLGYLSATARHRCLRRRSLPRSKSLKTG